MKLLNLNPLNAIYLSWNEGNCVMLFVNVHLLLTEFEVSTDLPLLGLGNVQPKCNWIPLGQVNTNQVLYSTCKHKKVGPASGREDKLVASALGL